MVTVDGGGDGDSEDGGNGISNGDNEGSCGSQSAQNEATLLTSVGSISLLPLLQCWRSVAVSHLLSFQRTSCGDHLCTCLLGLSYLGALSWQCRETQSSQGMHKQKHPAVA